MIHHVDGCMDGKGVFSSILLATVSSTTIKLWKTPLRGSVLCLFQYALQSFQDFQVLLQTLSSNEGVKWDLWIYQQKTPSNVLFVQTCYGRLHGPKGYGFGGGAGTLNTDSGNQIESEEKEKIQ